MYSNYYYWQNGNQSFNPYDYYYRGYPTYPYNTMRQQSVKGQASWTDGGPTTFCGIPWSDNQYMTAAVGENTPYRCGQTLKIRNLSTPGSREILVTVVDRVVGNPANRITLHRRAFAALGVSPDVGVIDIEIIPSPELEQEKWGKYLLELTQVAYPRYSVTEYNFINKNVVSPEQTKETYEFILQSPQDRIKIRGSVIYNPISDRVISFDLKEV